MTRHLLVIGAQRCGTTYLHDLLAAHPQIAMARRRGPSPRCSSPTSSPAAGWSGTTQTYFAHATDELRARREEHQLPRVRRGRRPRRAPCSATRWSSSSSATRSSGRCRTGRSAPTPGSRPGRSPRRSSANLDGPAAVGPRRARRSRRSPTSSAAATSTTSSRGWSAFGDDVTVLFLEEVRRPTRDAVSDLYRSARRRPGLPARRRWATPVNESTAAAPRLDEDLLGRLREYFARERPRPGRPARAAAALGRRRPTTDEESRDRVPTPRSRSTWPASRAPSSTTSRESLEGGHTSSGGPFSASGSRAAARRDRRRRGPADHLLHRRARDVARCCSTSQPGDTVIVPSFTFTTTALAFVARGRPHPVLRHRAARPSAPTPRTVADAARRLGARGRGRALRRHRLRHRRHPRGAARTGPDVAIVEDNAHGLFGRWRGQPLGQPRPVRHAELPRDQELRLRRGRRALLNDPADVDRAWVALRQGHRPPGVLPRPGRQVLLARHRLVVRAVRPLAAFLLGQLEQRERHPGQAPRRLRALRRGRWRRTPSELGLRAARRARTTASPAYHLFHVLLPDRETRDPGDGGAARARASRPTFHYVPLHDSDGGRRFAARQTECPVTSDVSGRLLRLPFHNNLTADDTDRVVDALVRVLTGGLTAMAEVVQSGSSSIGAARLLVVPRPHRPAAGRPGRLPRRARAGCSTSAAPTGRASSWMQRRPRAVRHRPRPAGADARARASAPPRWRCRSPTRPSTWSAPSTSSSTASPRPRRSPSWPGCSRPAAGCSPRCRPTSGRGPTTTSAPATTAATRGRRIVAAPRGRRADGAPLDLRASPGCSRSSPPSGSPAGCAGRAATPPAGCPQVSPAARPGAAPACRRAEARAAAQARPAVRLVGLPGRREAVTRPRRGSAQPGARRGPPRAAAARTPPPRPRGTPSRSGRAPAGRRARTRRTPGTSATRPGQRPAAGARPWASTTRVATRLAIATVLPTASSGVRRGRQRRRPRRTPARSSGGPASAPDQRRAAAPASRQPHQASGGPGAARRAAPRPPAG